MKIIVRQNINFNVALIFSMMDQKSINACVMKKPGSKGVDSCCCYICKLRSVGMKNFQNFESSTLPASSEQCYLFGISPLHGLLNFTKFVIYNVATQINEIEKTELNDKLTKNFKIDFNEIKRGHGSKITGNVARMFFSNFE